MSDGRDPVVIGHFPSSGEANLARNRLREAGIAAELTDDITADMSWNLTVAIGNVKLLVPEEQADQARAILDDKVTNAEIEYAARQTIVSPDTEDTPEAQINGREANAQRAYLGAIICLLFLPLQFYIFWVLVKLYVSNDPLSPRFRRCAWVALAINLPTILMQCVVLRLLLRAFVDEVL